MIHPRNFLLALTAFIGYTASMAQQSVDIGLYEAENGALEVRLTPTNDFDGVLSNLSFTLAWDNTTSATLGTPQQDFTTRRVAAVVPSGGVHIVGTTRYRIYTVVGLTSLSEAGLQWEAGRSYVLASFPVSGRVSVELATDAWVRDPHNNGEFYVSVGGVNATGSVVQASALVGHAEMMASVLPNPCDGQHLSVTVRNAVSGVNAVLLDILNAQGELVVRKSLPVNDGSLNTTIELDRTLAKGSYTVTLILGDRSFTERLIVAR